MKKLLIGSAVLAALLIKENIAVNAAIEQNETTPKIAVTDKKEKPKDQSDNSFAGHYDQETNFITWEISNYIDRSFSLNHRKQVNCILLFIIKMN